MNQSVEFLDRLTQFDFQYSRCIRLNGPYFRSVLSNQGVLVGNCQMYHIIEIEDERKSHHYHREDRETHLFLRNSYDN